MTTSIALAKETQRMLLSGTKEELNVLAAAITDTTSTTVTLTYDLRGIQEGSVIEVDTEQMYVVVVNENAKTATVIRGYQDSTAATHSNGVTVTVNPKFALSAIYDAQNDTVDDLTNEGFFRITTVEQTFNAAVAGYNLTGITDLIDVYRVSYQESGTLKRWPEIRREMWDVRRDVETDDFSTGFAVILAEGGSAGQQLRIEVKVPLTRLTATSQDVTTQTGLLASAEPLVKYGSAMKLVYWRETMRNVFEAQGDSRRADEVPAGANIGAARGWQAIYDRSLSNALDELHRRYP